ncbi:hypothetical protein ES703_17149 [subsurface metagenome]
MAKSKEPSAFQVFHKALTNHRSTFLTNACAEVYRYEKEPQRDGSIVRFWSPWIDSLAQINESITKENESIKRGDYDGEVRHLFTPQMYADRLLNAFGYEGMEWDVKSTHFDDTFDQDKDCDVVRTRWRIVSAESVGAIQLSAETAAQELPAVFKQLSAKDIDISPGQFRQMILICLFDGKPKWTAREVRWKYLWDLDSTLQTFELLANGIYDRIEAATDPTAYIPLSQAGRYIGEPVNYKRMRKMLRKCPWIRGRKPSKNRFEIHAGDWHRFLMLLKDLSKQFSYFDWDLFGTPEGEAIIEKAIIYMQECLATKDVIDRKHNRVPKGKLFFPSSSTE